MSDLALLLAGIVTGISIYTGSPDPIGEGADCSRSGTDWQQQYSRLDHYIPRAGDAVVTIHCNLIIWQDDEGLTNFQDTPEHRERLRNLFHHPTQGLNFQFYERFNPPSDPIIAPEDEIHNKNLRFELEGIYFIRNSKLSASISIDDKRRYLKMNGYEELLKQVNINITTSPGPMAGAWGHAELPDFSDQVPMICTTDNPNQRPYTGTPTEETPDYPVSIATFNGVDYYRDWSFMEHIAHELGHCLGLLHVYPGAIGTGYEACRTNSSEYMDDIFPVNAPWCDEPRPGCDVCLQHSSKSVNTKADPADGYTNNLMNGQGGRYLSPKQLGKIHRALATRSIGRAATGFSSEPLEINSDETWDFSMQLYRPLRIRKGVTLTIKCDLRMAPEAYIKVDKGARLIVDGGRVMSSDPNNNQNWRGFRLLRRKSVQSQLETINDGQIILPLIEIPGD